YDYPRSLSPSAAFLHFWTLISHRLAITLKNSRLPPNVTRRQQRKGRTLILRGFSMAEPDLYGPPAADFSLGYTFGPTLDTVLAASALWTPVPESNYQRWASSLRDAQVWDGRGYDKLGLGAGEVVINLCQPQKPNTVVLKGGQLPV